MYTNQDRCLLCDSKDIEEVIDLGEQYLASQFPKINDTSGREDERTNNDSLGAPFNIPKVKLSVNFCEKCSFLQLSKIVSNNEMYGTFYGYKSSVNDTMFNHLKLYNKELISLLSFNINDNVLDIGGNDGTFIKFYNTHCCTGINKYIIDPTCEQFTTTDDVNYIPDYFCKSSINLLNKKFKVVTSIAMFYDVSNPIEFATDVYNILTEDGIWSLELSYALDIINNNIFDSICHEHLGYYNLKNLLYILDKANLMCIKIGFNKSNGGSIRLYAVKKNSIYFHYNEIFTNKKRELLDNEKSLYNKSCYFDFMNRCNIQIEKLHIFLKSIPPTKSIAILGASTKGNTLLQYANIDSNKVSFAVERNTDKIGRMTPGTNIHIISEKEAEKQKFDFMLVLPWHFKDEIISREQKFLERGGSLIFPLPNFEIYTLKKKL